MVEMKLVSFGRPILDVTITLQPLKSYISTGGVETNVAINTALLGEDSILLGAIGLDILCEKLESLAQRVNKLRLGLQKIEDRKSGTIIMLIKENDEIYQKFVDYGASEYFRITSATQKQIAEREIFFTSLFSANTSTLRTKWRKIVQLAKSNSLKIVVSMAGIETIETNETSSFLKFVKNLADFIFINRREAEKIDLTIFTSQIVVITNEDGPAITKFGDRKWSVPPERIQTKSRPYTIGAGDAFTAAFLVSYLRDGDIEKAMRYGHRIAGLKLSIPTSHLIPEILKKEVRP
jgi:sugar/nucleoside kinase (ribokinase family)